MHGIPGVTGGTLPAQIWHTYMTAAMQGQPVEQFSSPGSPPYKPWCGRYQFARTFRDARKHDGTCKKHEHKKKHKHNEHKKHHKKHQKTTGKTTTVRTTTHITTATLPGTTAPPPTTTAPPPTTTAPPPTTTTTRTTTTTPTTTTTTTARTTTTTTTSPPSGLRRGRPVRAAPGLPPPPGAA